jgi:hypothetical protein
MLTIGPNGSIQVAIGHLLEKPPETWEGIIERYSKLEITLFHHIVSAPDCRYEKKFGRGRVPDEVLALSPAERLKKILKEGAIQGNPKGYFVNKHHGSLTPAQLDAIKSVSFALCGLDDVPKHFKARGSEYGICFFHDFLESSGIRPVTYLNGQTYEHQRRAIFNAPHLVEVCFPGYDMQWENEWRIKGRLPFTPADVAFLIVPDAAYHSFMEWLTTEDLYDYVGMPSSAFNNHLDYLRILPTLDHSSWDQIRIFDDFKLDFEEFEAYTDDDRTKMQAATAGFLPYIAKADVQELYEERYVSRWLKFAGQLNGDVKNSPLFKRLEYVDGNRNEPWRSSADLVKAAYTHQFQIQGDRIAERWREALTD